MFDRLIRLLDRAAVWKLILPLLVVTLGLMVIVNKINGPITVPRIEQISGGAGLLDMRLYYSPEEAYALLGQLHPEGRDVYLKLLLSFDVGFPALYAVTFSLIVIRILRFAAFRRPMLRLLALIPLAAGLFDWLENGCLLAMLVQYPAASPAASAAGILTLGKWSLTGASLAIVLSGLAVRLFASRTAKKGEQRSSSGVQKL